MTLTVRILLETVLKPRQNLVSSVTDCSDQLASNYMFDAVGYLLQGYLVTLYHSGFGGFGTSSLGQAFGTATTTATSTGFSSYSLTLFDIGRWRPCCVK